MFHNFTSYLYLSFYIIVWLVVCYNYYKKVKLSSGFIVIGSYLVYAILASLLYLDSFLGKKYDDLGLFSFLYLFVMLYMFLIPVFKFEKANVLRIRKPNDQIVQLILTLYAISAMIMLPNIISSMREGLTLLMLEASGGMELYEAAHENYVKRTSGVSGIYGLFSIFYNTFSDVSKFIFFYYLTMNNKKKFMVILFCFVIFIDLLYPISKGGRTDVIMNLFSVLMAMTLFYPFYSKLSRKIIKRCAAIVLIIVAIPFMSLTISRFGESSSGTSGGMLSYAGQAPLNFNINALDAGGTRNGDRTINLFKQFFIDDMPEDVGEVRYKYKHLKMDDSIFSTYVGDFVLDFGPTGAFLIFVCLSLFFYNKIRIVRKTTSFRTLLLVYFILCVSMHGGMYLFNYSFLRNLNILAFIFIYILVGAFPNPRKEYLYKL